MLNPIIQFKENNLKEEFEKIDKRLQFIIYALAGFIYSNFGKSIVLTELFRTQEQQDKYYSNNPAYLLNPWKSVHQYGRGADISAKYLTPEELTSISKFINSIVKYSSFNEKDTLITHDIGFGNHIHIQTDPSSMTILVLKPAHNHA